MKNCENCKYYTQAKGQDFGNCRIEPPVIKPDGKSGWPTVKPYNWCGKIDMTAKKEA